MRCSIKLLAILSLGSTLGACATSGDGMKAMRPFVQTELPVAVQVPAGNKVVMETVGTGSITYECRAKANMADAFDWFFVGPAAMLLDRNGKEVGKYFGPPATWQSTDGSKVTAVQLAVAPAQAGSLPLQLAKVNAAVGEGAMKGISYIQRIATQGGVAPSKVCDASMQSTKEVVRYQADYIFWSAV